MPLCLLYPQELDHLLALHQQWIESEGGKGRRADLTKADLRQCDFSHRKLTRSILEHADVTGARLSYADLRECRLEGIQGLNKADLRDVDFRGASYSSIIGLSRLSTSSGLCGRCDYLSVPFST